MNKCHERRGGSSACQGRNKSDRTDGVIHRYLQTVHTHWQRAMSGTETWYQRKFSSLSPIPEWPFYIPNLMMALAAASAVVRVCCYTNLTPWTDESCSSRREELLQL